jgi:hypothetical protein
MIAMTIFIGFDPHVPGLNDAAGPTRPSAARVAPRAAAAC